MFKCLTKRFFSRLVKDLNRKNNTILASGKFDLVYIFAIQIILEGFRSWPLD